MRSTAAALLMAFVATQSLAEPLDPVHPTRAFDTRPLSEPLELRAKDPIIAVRLTERIARDGPNRRERGILIGQDIAPNATLGLGLLKLKSQKSSLSPDPTVDGSVRGSRKAAVRLMIKFSHRLVRAT